MSYCAEKTGCPWLVQAGIFVGALANQGRKSSLPGTFNEELCYDYIRRLFVPGVTSKTKDWIEIWAAMSIPIDKQGSRVSQKRDLMRSCACRALRCSTIHWTPLPPVCSAPISAWKHVQQTI